MKRPATRLHAIEHGLPGQRRRAARNADTTPRSMGSLEKQIALVRGHASAPSPRGLQSIASRIVDGGARSARPAAFSCRFDSHQGSAPLAHTAAPAPRPTSLGRELPEFLPIVGGAFQVEPFYETPSAAAAAPSRAPAKAPGAPDMASGTLRATGRDILSPEHRLAVDAFAREVGSVAGAQAGSLGGQDARWDNALSQAMAQAPAPQESPRAAAAGEAPAAARPGHDVFDNLRLGMQYATSFDLGTVDLNHRFERFERELGLDGGGARSAAARDKPPVPVADAHRIDDIDIVADLAEIGAAQPAPPSATAPAAPPPPPQSAAPADTSLPVPLPAAAPTPPAIADRAAPPPQENAHDKPPDKP